MVEHARRPGARLSVPSMPTGLPLVIDVQRLLSGVTHVQLLGSIDVSTAPDVERRLIDIAKDAPPRPSLLLDLSGVTFLDDAGLDALLLFQDRVGAAAGSVELLSPSPSVVRLLYEAELDGESWMSKMPESPEPPESPGKSIPVVPAPSPGR